MPQPFLEIATSRHCFCGHYGVIQFPVKERGVQFLYPLDKLPFFGVRATCRRFPILGGTLLAVDRLNTGKPQRVGKCQSGDKSPQSKDKQMRPFVAANRTGVGLLMACGLN